MANIEVPLINGKAYEYADIIFDILGVPTPSISSIDYDEEQEKKNNFGAGHYAVSRGKGTRDVKVSFTMSMNDTEALRDAALNGSLLSIPMFDIIIVFGNPQKPERHIIKNFEFTKDGVSGTTGDTDMKYKHDGIASHIQYR